MLSREARCQLCEAAGIRMETLMNVLKRIRGVSPKLAVRLEAASKKAFGKKEMIPKEIWVFNKISKHPIFKR